MAEINVSKGQGISQAIKSKIESETGEKIKNSNLSIWQEVITEVKSEQDNGNNIYTGGSDIEKINDKTSWKTDFVVNEGKFEISDSTWNKILKLLTGKTVEEKDTKPKDATVEPENKPEPTTPIEDTTVENTPVVDVPVEENPVVENPVEDNPKPVVEQDDPQVDDPPVQDNPVNKTPEPVKDTPTTPQNNPVENPKPAEKRTITRAGVSGEYSLTETKNGGYSLLVDNMNVSLMNNEVFKFFNGTTQAGNQLREIDGKYVYRGISVSKSENLAMTKLQNKKTSVATSIAINNAIYNDLMTKQKEGTQLNNGEKRFIEGYLNSLKKHNLGVDENGNLIDTTQQSQ